MGQATNFLVQNKKPIIYGGAGIVAVTLLIIVTKSIRRALDRKRQKEQVIDDYRAMQQTEEAIIASSGMTSQQVSDGRDVALQVSVMLETHKDLGWWDRNSEYFLPVSKWLIGDYDKEEIIRYLNIVKTKEQMDSVAVFYNEEFTDNRNLKVDLESALSANDIKLIKSYRFLR